MRLRVVILAAVFLCIPAPATQGGNCQVPIGALAAAFSPAGSNLALVIRDGTCPRWRVGLSYRGDTVVLLDMPEADGAASSLSWSPGRRQFFVVGFVATRNAVVVYDAEASPGRQQRTIAEGLDPTWSPDGRWIAYTATREAIHIVAPDGTNNRRIAAGERPVWSPDSSYLAYHRQESIYIGRPDGSNERRLTAGETALWSPDGTWVGVLREGSAYLVRPDGSEERRIGAGKPIQWSPRGDEVALLDSAGVLRRVSLATGQTRRVAEDVAAAAFDRRWDPRATAIATVLRVGRRSEVYVSQGTGAVPARRTASQCSLYTARCVDGTNRADRIVGTATRDVIFPGAGDDRVWSRGGDDRIDATYGRDFVDAGPNNDIVYTHANDDVVLGGAGRDFLFPGNGEDTVSGGRGRDSIDVSGDGRVDRVRCGPGNDAVYADPSDGIAGDCETVKFPSS
jgi:RTX calcium-binding nonapeptide repeat (4 copies)/WD40-like Beta Propeller Repeat